MRNLARGTAVVLFALLVFAAGTQARAQGGNERIALKLRDGSEASLDRGELLARRADLAPLRRLLAEYGIARGALGRTFARSPEALEVERAHAERRSGRRLAELALFFNLELPPGTDARALAGALRALAVVESAQPWPKPVPPPVDLDPPTPDFTGLQTYTEAAPSGIGSADFVGFAGADGAGTRYADLEYDWQLAHEDLELPASALIPTGTAENPWMDMGSHGSAVLGILSARANGYGVTGLVPAAEVRVAATNTLEYSWDVARALEQTLVAFGPTPGPGDVILIEQQMYVCGYTGSGGSQLGAGPVEEFAPVRAIIQTATSLGVTVVEAAGNGSVDLDAPSCSGVFDRNQGDTGALIVSAGSASSHAPLSYSNYGSRVDVQGIGEGIASLGGGGLFGGADPLQRYQSSFGGSSAASAMVAGVVLSIQGMRIARGLAALDALTMRGLLVQTGTPQAVDVRQIGPLPDLAQAYALGVPATPVPVWPTSASLAFGALLLVVVAERARRS